MKQQQRNHFDVETGSGRVGAFVDEMEINIFDQDFVMREGRNARLLCCPGIVVRTSSIRVGMSYSDGFVELFTRCGRVVGGLRRKKGIQASRRWAKRSCVKPRRSWSPSKWAFEGSWRCESVSIRWTRSSILSWGIVGSKFRTTKD